MAVDAAPPRERIPSHRHVFLGGLHRSGTSLLAACLGEHPAVSCLRGTGVPEDEGQHLQNAYPPARAFGGPGRFGFSKGAHLTERSPLVTGARSQLMAAWTPFWDLSKTTLVEKSPPNLIRTRFLRAVFPGARFVMIVRHPVAVAVATQKWSRTSLLSLVEHWAVCHSRFLRDASKIPELHVVRYEDLTAAPSRVLRKVFAFLGLRSVDRRPEIRRDLNDRYFGVWRAQAHTIGRARRAAIETPIHAFGYSLESLGDRVTPAPSVRRMLGVDR